MSNDFWETFSIVCFAAVLFVFPLIETALTVTWNKTYYTTGLSIFCMKVPVAFHYSNIPHPSRFENHFRSTWSRSLVFKEIDSKTYGFRGKFFEWHILSYGSIMRGLLLFDSTNNQVIVKGFLYWDTLCLLLLFLIIIALNTVVHFPDFILPSVFITGFLALFFGFLYLIQHNLFSRVASFAAQEWSRKFERDVDGA